MSQVIYLPKTTSVGESLGEGMGAGIGTYMAKEMKRQEQQTHVAAFQKFATTLRAPEMNRDTAIQMAAAFPWQDRKDMQLGLKLVDELHPPKDTTLQPLTVFNQDTGAEKTIFAKKGDVSKQGVDALIPKGYSAEKPQIEMFVQPIEGGVTQVGSFPISKRPAGTVTMKEWEAARKTEADARADERATRQANRDQQNIENQAQRDIRMAQMAAGPDLQRRLAVTKVYNGVVASLLNVRHSIGAQGDLVLDFEGDKDKEKAYRNAIGKSDEFLQGSKGDPNKAAYNALDATGYFKEKPPVVNAATPPKEPGFADKAGKAIGKLFGISEDGEATAKPVEKKAAPAPAPNPDPAKRAPGVYQTPKGPMEWTGQGWKPAPKNMIKGAAEGIMNFMVPSASADTRTHTKAEADAAAKSGRFDDSDRKPEPGAASGADTGYKPGTNRPWEKGEKQFLELQMKRGATLKQAEAEWKARSR